MEAWKIAKEEATRTFDLQNGSLFRVKLLRLHSQDYFLLMTMHHIVGDAWSRYVLIREITLLYRAYAGGEVSPLPEPPIQYADYAIWQRHWFSEEKHSVQLEYWRNKLQGAPSILQFPTDRPRPPICSYRGGRVNIVFPLELQTALNNLSRQQNATIFMTLLAAFQVLLCRYSGQDDIVIGSPIANRTRLETENLIGFFVNTLVLRGNLSGNPTFLELLHRTSETALEAYAHQELPFEKLVEELHPSRDLSYQPLFQVMFVLQNAPVEPVIMPDLVIQPLSIDNNTAKFDLLLDLAETEQGLKGYLEYSSDLFDESSIKNLLEHFKILLEGIVANPNRRIGELPLLPPQEYNRQILEWNNTKESFPLDACFHHLFSEQTARSPQSIALIFENQQLTYAELEARSNQLGHYLQTLGVSAEVVVGLCVERSLEMVIGLLGILKAGGAYAPLDPAYPQHRIEIMLEDSHAPILLTQSHLQNLMPSHGAQVIYLDQDWSKIAEYPQTPPPDYCTPDNLAYVVFTSGSTGRPKGILAHHRGSLNHLLYTRRAYNISPADTILQNASLVSDASIEDLIGTLIAGCKVVLVSSSDAKDPSALVRTIDEQAVTALLATTPRFLGQLVEAAERVGYHSHSLRLIFVNGEALYHQECQAVQRVFGKQVLVVNQYGPTEGAITCSDYRVTSTNPEQGAVSLGRPISNTEFYLLDNNYQPVPLGVVGEIFIGGVGLARGYIGRPDLSAERFVPHPFSIIPGARLYRTGDLARLNPKGSFEYVGRADHQVKVRGYRVEPGEIEAALAAYSKVSQCAILAREDIPGDKRLVGYLVAKGVQPEVEELREYLKSQLPSYMIPSSFIMLDSFPLTPNGKVDRKALPAPGQFRPNLRQSYNAPRNELEEKLVSLWAEALSLEEVGIYDNFFELGGHSLLAMQLTSRISGTIGKEVSVKLLFLYPTIASMAVALANTTPAEVSGLSIVPPKQADTSHLTIERLPLLPRVLSGEIAPAQSAALSYLPSDLLKLTGLATADILQNWFEQRPILNGFMNTPAGRIALILLPIFGTDLYNDQPGLLKMIGEGVQLAGQVGAKTVSLTGLLPSATNYGRAVLESLDKSVNLPAVTTGHATTAASVVLSLKHILSESGRELPNERVVCLGLGSIGLTVLRLMLQVLPHPQELWLCDLYSRREHLKKIAHEVVNQSGFKGNIRLYESSPTVPDAIYEASLIIGASNVPGIIETTRLKAGTLLVDDSAPHCFEPEKAIRRFEQQGDILFTEGGTLKAPFAIAQQRYLPEAVEARIPPEQFEAITAYKPFNIAGCVLSSILSTDAVGLEPTIGEIRVDTALQHYKRLEELGYGAAELHCNNYELSEERVRAFRENQA